MLWNFFSSLVTLFISIHAMLYAPQFASLPPVASAADITAPLTLTTPTLGYQQKPFVAAEGAIVVENSSAEIVFAKNEDERLFPASTTKIMTALIAIEEMSPDIVASVSGHLAQDGSVMGLVIGERITVKDLLAGLLIPSANDAADEISRIYPGGQPAFINRMNQRAKELGLNDTHYTNPIGYSDPGHVTSVRDLAILAREAMQHQSFRDLVRVQSRTVTSIDGKILHKLKSTNELLGKLEGMEGIKTGWTEEAGECFVAQTSRSGQTFTTVVLKSPDRFGETKRLVEWAFASFKTETKPLSQW